MSIKSALTGFIGKYGPHSKLIASSLLNVIAPGSGALISVTQTAIEAATDIADDIEHKNWEKRLLAKINQGHEEVERLSKMIELLSGPLSKVCDTALQFAGDEQGLADVVRRSIAEDPSLSSTLHEIQDLKGQFQVFQVDIKRIARNQEEVRPVYERMNRVADYFDELWHSGVKPSDLADFISGHSAVSHQIKLGNTDAAEQQIAQLKKKGPTTASVDILDAAVATREFDYLSAQKALTNAVKSRPEDKELADIAQLVTVMATQHQPVETSDTSSSRTTSGKHRLKPGDMLEGWRLESRLGAGGWGQVFKANRSDETRAIKVMHPELAADAIFLQRFKKEIASLWGLPNHPSLLSIDSPEKSFGFCIDHQTWYLAMEYVDGPTLESYLANKGQLTGQLVHQVFDGLIDGLAQAHKAGIVHRDIKPANMIFRKSDQQLVLVDFGLAVGEQDLGQTSVGGMSVKFAAPEQHYGSSATKSSDVFSMCATMLYSLFYDDKNLRSPNQYSSDAAPESLREIFARGLAPNPSDRFADALELHQAMKQAKNQSISKRSGGPPALNREMAIPNAADGKVEDKNSPVEEEQVIDAEVIKNYDEQPNQSDSQSKETASVTNENFAASATHDAPPSESPVQTDNESLNQQGSQKNGQTKSLETAKQPSGKVELAPEKKQDYLKPSVAKGGFGAGKIATLFVVGIAILFVLPFLVPGLLSSPGEEPEVTETVGDDEKTGQYPGLARIDRAIANAKDEAVKKQLEFMRSNAAVALPDPTKQVHQTFFFDWNTCSSIPPEIEEMTYLRKFDFYQNAVTTLPPELFKLTNLESMNAGDNQIKEIPPQISQLKKLEVLQLHGNQIETIPEELYSLYMLKELDLSRNNLKKIDWNIAGLQNLEKLSLSQNELSTIPDQLYALKNLKYLYLAGNRGPKTEREKNKGFELPIGIGKLKNLEVLTASPNSVPAEVWELTNLTILDLSHSTLYALPSGIDKLTKLESLDLSFNNLYKLPEGFSKLQSLNRLDLSSNEFDAIPTEITQLINLESLKLTSNPITEMPQELFQLSKLKTLELKISRITEVPTSINRLENLETLKIGSLNLRTIPEEISELKKLRSLEIKFAKYSKSKNEEVLKKIKQKLPGCKIEVTEY